MFYVGQEDLEIFVSYIKLDTQQHHTEVNNFSKFHNQRQL